MDATREAIARETARQQAWADFEHAAKKVLQLEMMGRLKIDYSIYGKGDAAELIGTNELVRVPKRIKRSGVVAHGGRVR